MLKLNFQRDAFIDEVYYAAKKNKNIFFLSADFGAPALDRFRKDLKNQFIHCGISEQNMVNVAAGLAMQGKKVFVYAMAPFVTLRCLEQHKCCSAIMNLPIVTLVPGIGLGYADSGPTHYATEDLGSLRGLIGSNIFTASDSISSSLIAKSLIKKNKFSFVRLERLAVMDIYDKAKLSLKDIDRGFFSIKMNGEKKLIKKNIIITQGFQTQRILDLFLKKKIKYPETFEIIDLFQSHPLPTKIMNMLSSYQNIISIDEQIETSSISVMISNFMIKNKIYKNHKSFVLDDKYVFDNGGRERLLNLNGLSISKIQNYLNNL